MMNHNSRETNQGCGFGTHGCPIGEFVSRLKATFGGESEFRRHMRNSKIEFLKAIRSIIDKSIENLEQCTRTEERRATRVEVD